MTKEDLTQCNAKWKELHQIETLLTEIQADARSTRAVCYDSEPKHKGEPIPAVQTYVERLEELASAKDGVLTEKQREAYTRQNNVYIKKYIFPAYEQLISGLSELRSSGKNNNGLCYLPNGRTYYEYLVRSETGSPRSIAELQNLANTQILSDLTVMQRVLTGDSSSASSSITSDIFSPQGTLLTESDPEKILSTLSGKITKDFPPYPHPQQTEKPGFLAPVYLTRLPSDG